MARTVQLLKHDAYCPIKAEVRTVDNQSDLINFVIVMISYSIGLQFTHDYGDFSAIFVSVQKATWYSVNISLKQH